MKNYLAIAIVVGGVGTSCVDGGPINAVERDTSGGGCRVTAKLRNSSDEDIVLLEVGVKVRDGWYAAMTDASGLIIPSASDGEDGELSFDRSSPFGCDTDRAFKVIDRFGRVYESGYIENPTEFAPAHAGVYDLGAMDTKRFE